MNRTAARAAALVGFGILAAAACGGSNIEGGGGGGPACSTCYEVYVNGGIACGPGGPVDAWETLAHCACGAGPCNGACVDTFCDSLPADMMCAVCLSAMCSAELAGCGNN
jgi:hypothetical protein